MHTTIWGNIFTNPISVRAPLSYIFKELKKLNSTETYNPIKSAPKNKQRILNREILNDLEVPK